MTVRSLLLAVLLAPALVLSAPAFAATPTHGAAPAGSAAHADGAVAAGNAAAAQPASAGHVPSASDARAPSAVDALGYRGLAFDTCAVPSLDDMRAWHEHSQYGAIGIYIGGESSGCRTYNSRHLTRHWVERAHAMGWRLIPIYVGSQATCAVQWNGTHFPHLIDTSRPAEQGAAEAERAIHQMRRLGLGAGNPIYYNMENWNHRDEACTTPVLTFLDSWTVVLHQAGYVSGLYSSAGNGMPAIVTAKKIQRGFHAPDAIWFARHDDARTYFDVGDPTYVPDDVWTTHSRIKQYRGPHEETHGGVSLTIDSDYVDAPVTGALLELELSLLGPIR